MGAKDESFKALRSRLLDEKISPFNGVVVCTCHGDPEIPCVCTSAQPDELVREAEDFAEYLAEAHYEALRQYYGLPI